MRRFLLKGILFFIIIFFICAGVLYLSAEKKAGEFIARWTNSTEFSGSTSLFSDFKNAKRQDGKTMLVIGDSICKQMFSDLKKQNPDTRIIASNAAFMITGQYALAEAYLRNHPDATDVFLVMHPLALTRTFDLEWSYRYSVMVCSETDTLQYLDESTIDAMADVYGRFFLRADVIRLIERSPLCRKLYLSYINANGHAYEQNGSFEIADQYVKKLCDLCEERGAKLHMYASPVAEHYREEMGELEAEYRDTWMYTRYPDYFDAILYYPSERAEDLSHFSGEYAERDALNETIREAYAGSILLEKIKLEAEPEE